MDTVVSPANQDYLAIWNVKVCQIRLMMVFREKLNFCYTLDYFTFFYNAGASQSSLNNENFGLQKNRNVPDIFLHKATQTDHMHHLNG